VLKMSIVVKRKGNKFSVETDYPASCIDHSMIHGDNELKGAMRSFGIKEVKGREGNFSYSSVRDDFDEKFKKKYGRDTGYLSHL
jgi:hypothetical protein